MGFRQQYEAAKATLAIDSTICDENRRLFAEFFAFQEYKLKRQNGLPELDDGCYSTLYGYIQRLRNVNRWFENKPWKDLTRDDIKRVYDALEDGTIRNRRGLPFEDRQSYYNKVFKSKPFRLAGKEDLAREVIEFSTATKKPVRFVTEESFRKLVSCIANPRYLLLLWLAWDIGENIDALLQLTKRDLHPQANKYNQEREYLVNLPQAKLKRTRQSRSEVTLYRETVQFADIVMATAGADDLLFPFGYRRAAIMLADAVERSGATTMPDGQAARWKDLRSGMACHLLKNGWTRDEVNARLGHTPHSSALDAYINFLALDRDKPKQRLMQSQAAAMQQELATVRQTAQLASERLYREEQENRLLRETLQATKTDIDRLRLLVESLIQSKVA